MSGVTIVSKEDAERELRREAKRDKKRDKKKEKKKRKDSKKRDGGGGGSSSDDASDDDRDRRERSFEPRDTSGGVSVAREGPGPSSAPSAPSAPSKREGWMTSGTSFGEDAAKARDPRSSSQRAREEAAARSAAVAAERELNPHWSNGGDGFKPTPGIDTPEGEAIYPKTNALLTAGASGGVGDGGASWRLKALRRAKERAAEEGKSLSEVVSDRWGSVSDLVDSIGANAAHGRAHLRRARDAVTKCFRCGEEGHFARECPSLRGEAPSLRGAKRPREPLASERDEDIARAAARRDANGFSSVGLEKPRMRKPEGLTGSARAGDGGDRRTPGGERARVRADDRDALVASAARETNAFASDGSFFAEASAAATVAASAAASAPTATSDPRRSSPEARVTESASFGNPRLGPRAGSEMIREQPSRASAGVAPSAPATMRAPSGNVSAAAALRAKLMGPRKTAEKSAVDGAAAALPLVGEDGRAAPGAFGRATTLPGGAASAEGAISRAPRTTQRFDPETKEKVRYYRDDDGATLRDLVAAEKHGGGAFDDYEKNFFENVAGDKRYKGSKTERERDEAVDDEYDNDLGLEMYEKRDKKQSGAKQQEKARQRQVAEYERSKKKLASCALCLDNPRKPLKHLHVAYGNHAYLMLPASGRLVPGHCVIAPIAHCRSSRACDEQAWEEMRNFKKCLTKMFAAQGKEACFLETCVGNGSGGSGAGDVVQVGGGLGSRFETSGRPIDRSTAGARGGFGFGGAGGSSSHGFVECVPIPSRVSANAPMYFKKAIDESESEWSTHAGKRCLSTAPPKGLRQSIPESFPYFHVEFNMRGGFAHVVDDETRWNRDFGRDVLVGLLGLQTENAKKRALAPAVLKREMDAFLDAWEPVDWTKQL